MNKYKRTIEITEEELNAVEDIFFCQVSEEEHVRIWPLLAHVWEQLCPEDIKTLKKQRAAAQFIGSGPQGVYQALMKEREQERELERKRERSLGVPNENNKT